MSVKEIDRIPTIKKLSKGEMTARKAACNLNLSVRHVRRLKKRFTQEGVRGLIHKSRGRISKRKISKTKESKIMNLIKKHYCDFGPTLAHEKLTENHRVAVSRETLRKMMIKEDVWKAKRRKEPKVHQQRERRPKEGELVQADGSPHDWFEERSEKCCLLLAIDDATGKIKEGLFVPTESTNGYFLLMRNYILRHGKPLALYVDRNSIFAANNNKVNPGKLTQFGQAMKELSIELILANSPQAKGRVERANKTLQDRLIKEMRLKGISDIKKGNKYLPKFIKFYNKKFAVVPRDNEYAHRPLLPSEKLEKILVKKYTRVLSKNLEFQHENNLYQVKTTRPTYAMRNATVLVTKDVKGKTRVYYKGKELTYKAVKKGQRQEIKSAKEVNRKVDKLVRKPVTKPAKDHPWRYFTL